MIRTSRVILEFIFIIIPLLLVIINTNFVLTDFSKNTILRPWHMQAPRAKLETDPKWIQESLDKHNYYRKLHGVPPLVLNHTLCEISQHWANERASGAIGHNPARGYLGENIYTVGVTGYPLESEVNVFTPIDAWYNEIEFYDFNSCKAFNNEKIGHFTQIVWNSSKEFGLATTYYQTEDWDYLVVVANYYPPGNVIGRYQQNVFPLVRVSSMSSLLSSMKSLALMTVAVVWICNVFLINIL